MMSRLAILGVAAFWITACGAAVEGGSVASGPELGVAGNSDTGVDPTDPTDRADAGAPPEPLPPPASATCDCASSADEAIELHVLARKLSRERMDALAALLAKDGFAVQFVEYADESSAPKVAIETAPSRFVAVFRGRIESRSEALSSRDGFMCRPAVEGAVIPKRYRKLVRAIETPDPQLY